MSDIGHFVLAPSSRKALPEFIIQPSKFSHSNRHDAGRRSSLKAMNLAL
jgi:hypothetical protein